MNAAEEILGLEAHTLNVAIQAHGETITDLKLRRPTVAEVRKIGRLPYITLDADGHLTPDLNVTPAYISVCAGIPPSSVDKLDLTDLNQLSWAICSFFVTPA